MFKAIRSKTLYAMGSLALLLAPRGVSAGPGYSLGFTPLLNNNVSVPHNTALNAYPITVTTWVLTSQVDAAYRGIVQKTSNTPTNGYALTVRNGYLFAAYARNWTSSVLDGTNALAGGYVADGQWHHVALVVDSSGGRLYLDGVLQTSHAWNGTAQACTPATPLVFGRYNGNTLDCTLDEVTLWNVAKTEGEIQAMMHLSLSGSEAGLVGYWRLDEGAGTTTANLSSYGTTFNGNLNNSPTWNVSTAPIGLPVVTTLGATDVTGSSATLNGNVLPNYQSTTAFFQYGQTVAYGSTTASTGVGANNSSAVPVAQSIAGLESGRTYCYRLVAVNSAGTSYGDNGIFMTPPSTDASLSTLVLNADTLSPAFNKDVFAYTVNVPNSANAVQVGATSSESHASIQVRVNGGAFAPIASGTWSAWLPVNVGSNPIDVRVTAQDGTTVRTYTITVNRPPSTNANLAGLILSTGTLAPVFSPGTTSYSASVANEATSVYVTPTAADSTATIRVRINGGAYGVVGSGLPSPSLALVVGNNFIDIQVTAQDGTTVRTYLITVSRAPSSNSYLSNLTISAGTLTPAFDFTKTDYTVSVSNNVSSMSVAPTAAEANATIRVRANGGSYWAVTSGTPSPAMSLSLGTNTIEIRVTAQDEISIRSYWLEVTRIPSTNSSLAALTISAGTLSPAFATGTTNYTVMVPGAVVSNMTVTATAADPAAMVSVRINTNNFIGVDSGAPSSPLPLLLGTNTIYIRVNAQDPAVLRDYIVGVIREPSTNADLASLAINPGTVSPLFSPDLTNYSGTVSNNVNYVTINPVAAEAVSSVQVRVNGGSYSSVSSTGGGTYRPVVYGTNTADIRITAQDGATVKIYTLVIYRELNSNANLAWLQMGTASGTKYLSPVFTPNNTNYTCDFKGADDWFRVTATAADTNASLRLLRDGVDLAALSSDVPGPYLSLPAGILPMGVRVTAQDGTTTRTYFIGVHRPSTNAYLSNLTLSAGTLSPTFQKLNTKYTAAVPYTVSNLAVTATAESPEAYLQIAIGTNAYVRMISGQPSTLPLQVGQNFIAISIIPEDIYTASRWCDLTVTRAPSPNARLASLVLSQGDLVPLFSPATTNYGATVAAEVENLTVTPTAEDPMATVQLRINGGSYSTNASGVASPPLPLKPGINSIDVKVISPNGSNTLVYSTVVSKNARPFVTTLAPTAVRANGSANVSQMVTPNGLPTLAWFEWGTNGAYQDRTFPAPVGSGFGVVLSTNQIAGFNPDRPCFVRAVASNSVGVVYGAGQMMAVARRPWICSSDPMYTNAPAGLSNLVAISVAGNHVLALREDGRVAGWGEAYGYVTNAPPDLTNAIAIAAGGQRFNLALRSDGTVAAWGSNDLGQINVPAGLSNVVAISAGSDASFALKADGTVAAWGSSYYGLTNVPPGISNIVAIAAGGIHALTLKHDGTVVGWGNSSMGALDFPTGLTNVVALAAGYGFNLALKKDGTVMGWGANSSGQSTIPADLTNVVAIAAGWSHSLALRQDGRVAAWGGTNGGEVLPRPDAILASAISGTVFTTVCLATESAPVATPLFGAAGMGVEQWIALAASDLDGDPVTLRIRTLPQAGTLYQCLNGSRGDAVTQTNTLVADAAGRVIYLPLPGQTGAPLDTFQYVAADGQLESAPAAVTLSVYSGGAPYCSTREPKANAGSEATLCGMVTPNYYATTAWFEWGTNTSYGNTTPPAALGYGGTVANVNHRLTGLRPGLVYYYRLVTANARGTTYGFNQLLAVGKQISTLMPGATQPPADLRSVTAISGSRGYALALRTDGSIVAWGDNSYGQCSVPAGLGNVAGIRSAGQAGFALLNNGRVASWGAAVLTNATGSLSNVVDLAGGLDHAVALFADGRIYVWGSYDPSRTYIPPGLSNVVQVAAGSAHTLALKDDGTVVGWGDSYSPARIVPPGLTGVVAITACDLNSMALKSDGTVVSWGDNTLGLNNVPSSVTNAQAIASSANHLFALTADRTIIDWGSYIGWPVSLTNVLAIGSGSFGLALTGYNATEITPPAAPRFASCDLSGPGGLHLAATGSPGVVYQVWATTNLSAWTLLGLAAETAPGIFEFTDGAATNYSSRFYRLRWTQP